MVVDLTKPIEPQADEAVKIRDMNHHVDENDEPKDPAFEAAVRDQYAVGKQIFYINRYKDPEYLAIRGREQQMIDYKGGDPRGGARSDTGKPYKTENAIRGVRKNNPLGYKMHDAASFLFGGEIFPYTGTRRP